MSAILKQKGSAFKAPTQIYSYGGNAAVFAGPAVGLEQDKPVVVFVPGLGGKARFFWEGNSMCQDALNSGFRTAFVNFDQPDGKSQNMWSNGEMLAKQLEDICSFFHVQKVIVVAHSKGGVDAQTAAVHFGAAERIDSIITLSTPHFGSQLADIAYSTAGWAFAELIKAHSPGCYCMQTSFMRDFRKITDFSPQNTTPIKTFAGNGRADELSRLWFGSLILDRFGPNDGVVTVASAHNPKGAHYGTLHFNHQQMSEGRYVFEYLRPLLEGRAVEPVAAASAFPAAQPPAHILRGGRLERGASEHFFVDSTVESFIVTVSYSGRSKPNHFILTAPDGHRYVLVAKKDPAGIVVFRALIKNPQVGKWKLSCHPCKGAYCAVICLGGAKVFSLGPPTLEPTKLSGDLRILRTYADGYDVVAELSLRGREADMTLPELKSGAYNVEMHLTGTLSDGSIYERSLVRPMTAGANVRELLTNQLKDPSK